MQLANNVVRIFTHTTYFEFNCNKFGYINGRISIKWFLKSLTESVYNPRLKTFQILYQYCYFDPKQETLSLPINVLDTFTEFLGEHNYEVIPVVPVTPRTSTFNMKSKFQLREEQEELISFLADPDTGFKALSARTGIGKSLCTVVAVQRLQMPVIIFTLGLVKQWYNEFLDKTHLKKSDIYVIQGAEPLRKLIDAVDAGYKPKVIIASIRTMSMYASGKKLPYSEILPYAEFLQKLGIGITVVDECHRDFFAHTMIMLRTNVKHNIFLSATYERSSDQGERIFSLVFPSENQYGSHLVRKYSDVIMFQYKFSKPLQEQWFITPDGYSHNLFESRILRDKMLKEEFMKAVVDTTIDVYFLPIREKNQKCLFICSTKSMVDNIGSYINRRFPALGVLCFYGDDDDSSITNMIDVVISTERKSGTGRDIRGLRVGANTISFKSRPLAKQMMGRVREIVGVKTYFLDFHCGTLSSHVRHALKRKARYQDLALTFYETNV